MLEKLKLVEARYLEMAERAAQPDFYNDPKAASQLLKEQRQLEPIITAYRSYMKTTQEQDDLRAMLSEGLDPEMKALCQEEFSANKKKLEELEQELKILLLPRDPNDDKNVIVEIRAGAGGDEAALFGALLATMMIPGELFTITNYQTIFMLGWQNTYTVLIVPFLVSVFYIYLLRQNFLQIPNELYLAAKVDGTSDFKYLWKVMVPLSLPTLISITILKMMGAWNSYVWPRLVANDDAHKLITNGLRNAFNSSTGETNYPVQMAAVAMVSFPLFLVFIFLRKYIMSGVSRSGIKG